MAFAVRKIFSCNLTLYGAFPSVHVNYRYPLDSVDEEKENGSPSSKRTWMQSAAVCEAVKKAGQFTRVQEQTKTMKQVAAHLVWSLIICKIKFNSYNWFGEGRGSGRVHIMTCNHAIIRQVSPGQNRGKGKAPVEKMGLIKVQGFR